MSTRSIYVLRGVVALVAASAFVAIWGGWVGLGGLAGFGPVNLLPGIGRGLTVDLAITLPLGVEAFAAIALYVAVSGIVTGGARVFAWCSAVGSLIIGAAGQAAYHLLTAAQHAAAAPTPVVVFVSVLPVVVLGLASILLHLAESAHHAAVTATTATTVAEPAAEPDDDPDDPDGGPDWEPWDPTDDPDSDQIWQAINRTGQRTLTESGSDSDGGRTVPRSLIPEGLRVDELPSDRRRTAAHQILADVDHPHRDTLAATHGMSARWWGDRIAEVRGSRAAG